MKKAITHLFKNKLRITLIYSLNNTFEREVRPLIKRNKIVNAHIGNTDIKHKG